ncbi:hypothetical protein TNIN_343461 [Trichonephila inaurata madagascariensis]|uniref:Uncharacterized protein n=1 Tax=Trichonephila inaurata madagascariensis TaxID=2747483 RepID=A0A8X6XY12_9ARAC|nr:hypothetical protein TNIN_343461 [Trichonephila inaurata madagascariensis]
MDKYTPKNSPTSDTDGNCINTQVQDEPMDFSKKKKSITTRPDPFLHYRMFPVYPTLNNPEPKVMNNTSDLQPRNAHIKDSSTSQGFESSFSTTDRLMSRFRSESFRNGNKSPTVTRMERRRNRNSPVGKVFGNHYSFASEMEPTIRRLEGQNTVGEISETPLSANGPVFSEHNRIIWNNILIENRKKVLHRNPPGNLKNGRAIISVFFRPLTPKDSPYGHFFCQDQKDKKRVTNPNKNCWEYKKAALGEAPCFFSSPGKTLPNWIHNLLTLLGKHPAIMLLHPTFAPFSPPHLFQDLSPEDPKYSLGMGMQLQKPSGANPTGLSIQQTQPPRTF